MYGITPTEPDEAYLSNLEMKKTAANIKCHRIGRIIAFNKEDLTCDVELLEKTSKSSGGYVEYAPLLQLPLIIEGTDTAHLTWGNIVGSECFIHFNDRDIDNWFKTGEKYTPNSTRLHNFSDGFVTLRPYSNPNVFEYDDEAVVLENENCKIRITSNTVQITNNNLNFMISGDTLTVTGNIVVNGDITASGTITGTTDVIASGISGNSHTHGGVTSGQSNTGVPQ